MSITSRINEMSSHIEQAYDELQGLGADLTNVNKNIENISMVLDDIYDSMPQVSGEGTNLTLDDTRVGKIKSTLKGNTSQSGTPTPTTPIPVNVVSGDNEINVCGKNLFNKDNVSIGYLKEDGTLSADTAYRTSDFMPIRQNTTYYKTSTGSPRTKYFDINKVPLNTTTYWDVPTGGSAGTFTTPNNAYYLRLSFPFAGSSAIDANTIMVKEGTDTTYEPYQGNTYNIDLGGLGKNKFDINSITKGIELNSNTGQTQVNSSWWASAFIPIKPNQAYTSSNISSNSKYWYDDNKNFISYIQSQTATSPANAKYLRVNGTLASLESNPQAQIEEGNSVTTFEAYNSIELCKIGNYQDYFYKDSGKWYLHREIGKRVLNGNETWYRYSSNSSRSVFETIGISDIESYSNSTIVPNLLSNRFKSTSQNATWVIGDISRRSQEQNHLYLVYTGDTSIEDFKTYLSNNNVSVYYVLATPTITELTYEPLITQLNLLEKALSKDGQTNISQVNNDLPFIISASALKEWQESTSLNSTLSMVNPLSLENTLNTQKNDIQPIEVDNIEPLEEEENEES